MNSTLETIFYNNLTKSSGKWSNYFDIYHKHFDKFLNKPINLLEIGVSNGGSLEMWHEYFGKLCNIFAIDLDTNILNLKFDFNVDLVIGDQNDSIFWNNYLASHPKFDIVIDDGSHAMTDQITTLINIFPHLNDGGVLVIEDTHTSYWGTFDGGVNNPDTFIERSKSLIDFLHRQHIKDKSLNKILIDIFCDLFCISFYNSVVVFEKKSSISVPVYNNITNK